MVGCSKCRYSKNGCRTCRGKAPDPIHTQKKGVKRPCEDASGSMPPSNEVLPTYLPATLVQMLMSVIQKCADHRLVNVLVDAGAFVTDGMIDIACGRLCLSVSNFGDCNDIDLDDDEINMLKIINNLLMNYEATLNSSQRILSSPNTIDFVGRVARLLQFEDNDALRLYASKEQVQTSKNSTIGWKIWSLGDCRAEFFYRLFSKHTCTTNDHLSKVFPTESLTKLICRKNQSDQYYSPPWSNPFADNLTHYFVGLQKTLVRERCHISSGMFHRFFAGLGEMVKYIMDGKEINPTIDFYHSSLSFLNLVGDFIFWSEDACYLLQKLVIERPDASKIFIEFCRSRRRITHSTLFWVRKMTDKGLKPLRTAPHALLYGYVSKAESESTDDDSLRFPGIPDLAPFTLSVICEWLENERLIWDNQGITVCASKREDEALFTFRVSLKHQDLWFLNNKETCFFEVCSLTHTHNDNEEEVEQGELYWHGNGDQTIGLQDKRHMVVLDMGRDRYTGCGYEPHSTSLFTFKEPFEVGDQLEVRIRVWPPNKHPLADCIAAMTEHDTSILDQKDEDGRTILDKARIGQKFPKEEQEAIANLYPIKMEQGKCCICHEMPACMAFTDCGHMCICSGCFCNLQDEYKRISCPLCQNPHHQENIIRIYM